MNTAVHLQLSFYLYDGQHTLISQGSVGLESSHWSRSEDSSAGLMGAQSTQVHFRLWRDKHKSSITINNKLQDVLHARSVLLHLK